MCLICMKYRIIILIIIIISLSQILLSYIANTSRTCACAPTRAHACASTHPPPSPPYRLALFVGAQPWRPASLAFITGSRVIQINTRAGHPISPRFWMFFAYKKCYAKLRRDLVTGCIFRRYEQLETSPETIEQELRPAVCERRQTDLRIIIV